jgi:hypothetical protein
VWLPSEILPIVSINTGIPSMRGIWVWTPHCLEMKHIEIGTVGRLMIHNVMGLVIITNFCIWAELVQEIYCDLVLSMGECTHISIVTGFDPVWVTWAKFDLVLLRMVELLYPIVRARTAVLEWALIPMLGWNNILTDLWGVWSKGTSPVFFGFMIIKALFRIVLIAKLAWLSLKIE